VTDKTTKKALIQVRTTPERREEYKAAAKQLGTTVSKETTRALDSLVRRAKRQGNE